MNNMPVTLVCAALGSAIFCFFGKNKSITQTAFIFIVATLGGWLLSPTFSRLASIEEQEASAFVTAFIIFPFSEKLLQWIINIDFARWFSRNRR